MYRKGGKRAFDLLIAVPLLVLVFPLTVVVGIAVRLRLGSPLLFRQTRPGRGGAPFQIVKFRSMTNACDSTGNLLPDADRLTRFGMFLRSSSLDELPELWNVVRGDMSLVGPRPLRMAYLDRYTTEQSRRHEIRPGITGWAQVNGRNNTAWPERFEQDVWYVDHCSFGLDLRIIWLTVGAVVRRHGISEDGHVTAREFLGSNAPAVSCNDGAPVYHRDPPASYGPTGQ